MMPAELDELLQGGESRCVEFKSDVNDDRFIEAVVCLANGEGGRLVLGVDDDGTVIGARPRHGDRTDGARLAALVANKTTPSVSVDVEVFGRPSGPVVVVTVPKARALVATTSGLYVRRAIDVNGKPQCVPMPPNEVTARMARLGAQDVSMLPLPDLGVEDLDPAELRRFRDLARSGGDSMLAELSDVDLLAALGLRTTTADLTLGAVLLFGTTAAIRRFAPTHETAFQVLDALEVRVNRIECAPLVKSMIDLADAIKPHNPEDEVEEGLFRLGLPAYSEVAIRELLANALVHRDYAMNGQVRIVIEDQTLSITSAGSFPEGITLGNLLAAPPQPRNPRLADAFKRAGLVERTGRGVNRVFRSQLALGRPQPDYSRSTDSWVEVRLRSAPADRELAAFAAQAQREGKPLSLQTLQVLHEVRAERRITSTRTAKVLQLSTDEARAILNNLVERGYLEARGEGKGRTYHLTASMYRQMGGPASYVRTRGFDEIQQQQMVLTYVTEHGSATRAEVAELCQLNPDQATRLLRRLTDSGALEMTGARRTARYRLPGADNA